MIAPWFECGDAIIAIHTPQRSPSIFAHAPIYHITIICDSLPGVSLPGYAHMGAFSSSASAYDLPGVSAPHQCGFQRSDCT